MARPKNKAREEARKFVGDGNLRYVLEKGNYNLSQEAIDKIVDACCFVLKV